MKIGHGFDVHRFGKGDHVILGGVNIPHKQGLIAHSDGDVVLHALCDALLGAVALGDIGHHFPDTEAAWEGADSRVLLQKVYALVEQRGYKLGNADMTIVAQAPRLADHISAMCENIVKVLDCSVDAINVKATTTEKLGFEGREEGISAHAVVLIIPSNPPSNPEL